MDIFADPDFEYLVHVPQNVGRASNFRRVVDPVDETRIACTTKLGLQIVLVDLKVLR